MLDSAAFIDMCAGQLKRINSAALIDMCAGQLKRINIFKSSILLTKITAVQNEVALSYNRVRGLYSLAVIFAANISQAVISTE